MTGPDHAHAQLSADGRWWWDGRLWVAAQSADGFWHWDGREWWTRVPLDQPDPAELASSLNELADERYLEAGAILARRRREWQPPEELAALVDDAHAQLQRLDTLEARLARLDGQLSRGLGGIFAWVTGGPVRVERLRSDLYRLQERLRGPLIEIAERATQPTLKETDEILPGIGQLRDRALALSSAASALEAARREHIELQAAAEAELLAAQDQIQEAIQAADEEIENAIAAQLKVVDGVRQELGRARIGDRGEHLASFESIQLFERWIETPDGKGLVEGAEAIADTAPALWKTHSPLLTRLMQMDSTGARAFHEAESAGGSQLFLLVITDAVKSVVACPPGEEEAAKQFARTVGRTSAERVAARPARDAWLAGIEAQLRAGLSDQTAIDRARDRRAKVESDKRLRAAVHLAEEKIAQIEADDTATVSAQERVNALIAAIAQPPEPLRSTSARAAEPEPEETEELTAREAAGNRPEADEEPASVKAG